ncbi:MULTISPECIES: hypothetical protein [unclassified Shewanella]
MKIITTLSAFNCIFFVYANDNMRFLQRIDNQFVYDIENEFNAAGVAAIT